MWPSCLASSHFISTHLWWIRLVRPHRKIPLGLVVVGVCRVLLGLGLLVGVSFSCTTCALWSRSGIPATRGRRVARPVRPPTRPHQPAWPEPHTGGRKERTWQTIWYRRAWRKSQWRSGRLVVSEGILDISLAGGRMLRRCSGALKAWPGAACFGDAQER